MLGTLCGPSATDGYRAALLLAILVAAAPLGQAAPNGAELLATCDEALAGGYRGIAAAMCDWYVAPCGVCGAESALAPRAWCVPATLKSAELARVVVAELKRDRAAASRSAPELVAAILAARYPCPER